MTQPTVNSNDTVKITGFYRPIHFSSCAILENEKKIFMCKGSTAPILVECQHVVPWELMEGQ